MPNDTLTDPHVVETIEEGGGSVVDGVDYFRVLLANAHELLAQNISDSARLNARLIKMEARLNDWLEMNDINASRQIPLTGQGFQKVVHREGGQRPNERIGNASQGPAVASRSKTASSSSTASKSNKGGINGVSKTKA